MHRLASVTNRAVKRDTIYCFAACVEQDGFTACERQRAERSYDLSSI